jgi:hypothetical protein
MQWAIHRENEGLGRLRAAWYFAHYAAHAADQAPVKRA